MSLSLTRNSPEPGVLSNDQLAGIRTRYEQFQRHDEDKSKFMTDLIASYDKMTQEYQAMLAARNQDRAWLQQWQTDRQNYEQLLRNAQRIMYDNQIVVVLIDGDGMIFLDEFLRDGERGGRRAASMLHAAMQNYVENECDHVSHQARIVCRIYANVRGLAEVLVRAGAVQEISQFEEFVRGFTRGKTLFDFVDVGPGKDRADDKIIESFKLYAQDFHCRRLFFGCSHDNGYARTLEACSDRVEMVNKVVLLEGVPFEKELVPLPYKTKKYPKLFRDKKLKKLSVPPWGLAPTISSPSPTASPFVPGTPFDSKASLHSLAGTGLPVRFPAAPATVQPSGIRMDSPLSSAGQLPTLPRTPSCSTITSEDFPAIKPAMTTWASKAAAPAPPQAASVLPSYKSADREEMIARNRVGQRVDPPCKDYDKAEVDRIKKMKLCNIHFLRAECPFDKQCTHLHSYLLTPDEKATLRLVARMAPCAYGSSCGDIKCIYGHRCPAPPHRTNYVKGTKSCMFGESCKFPPELHDIDTNVVKTLVIR